MKNNGTPTKDLIWCLSQVFISATLWKTKKQQKHISLKDWHCFRMKLFLSKEYR